jgi:enediyne biosynthesis protein E4
LGNGLFEDATSSAKIAGDLFAHVHWGTGFIDFDNDGNRDLFVSCGHLDRIELIDDRTAKNVRNYLLRNRGDGTFVDVSRQAGSGLAVVASSRGAAFGDLDNDGRMDAVILNSGDAPTILRNESQTDHHWLQVQLHRPETNRFAIGAQVRVVTGDRSQLGISISGRGYQSHFGTRIHFGLGTHSSVDLIEVRWPDGQLETFQSDGVDRLIKLTQGTGQAEL